MVNRKKKIDSKRIDDWKKGNIFVLFVIRQYQKKKVGNATRIGVTIFVTFFSQETMSIILNRFAQR
jgi:hypothetical protein